MDVLLGLALVALVVWTAIAYGRKRKRRQAVAEAGTRPKPARPVAGGTASGSQSVARSRERIAEPQAPHRMPFARPGMSGPLFSYGGAGGGTALNGPYAMVDVETTGFSPQQGDRVIEIAIARADASGHIEDEYATLLNPQGRDVGATFVHGITNDAVRTAPCFGDVVGDVLARLDGAVVVAHNAAFEERFLYAELARAGVHAPQIPALCTLWLGQQTFTTPNHKLHTLCQNSGVPLPDAHAALGDTRAVARLLPVMLDRYGGPLRYRTGVPRLPSLPVGVAMPKTRAVRLRKGTDGWMASLMSRLPLSASEATTVEAETYLSQLSIALEDGKIVGTEAKELARLAGSAGLGAAQVAALNERFLESMREAALDDHVVAAGELRELRNAAAALGVPDYFDDLQPTSEASPNGSAASSAAATAASPAELDRDGSKRVSRQRRCGHCRQPGHYRTTCPELAGAGFQSMAQDQSGGAPRNAATDEA